MTASELVTLAIQEDEAKNLENIRKHEIDFADVPSISFQHEEPTVMSKKDLNSTSRTKWAALESRSEENKVRN